MSFKSPNISRRLPLVGAAAAGAVVLLAGPAFAHVSVQPGEAEQGGYSTIAFKVPNERDSASTVKLEVNLPTDHPLASVMPQPVPGWDVKVTKSTLDKPLELHGKKITEAATKVTWTAKKDGEIKPGTFQQFPLSVGQLPEDTDQLVFKALQTYSGGEVVRWIEEPKEGSEEPESPAPVLKLTAPAEGSGHSHGGSGSDTKADKAKAEGAHGASGTADEHEAAADSSDGTARALGVLGIVVGAAGVAFGALAGRRRSS
ncbi:YcnI family protein [Streptomyces pathocidini]|uniref:YcnI family protein n=1 Tax=Streptomyces pathocidini TaxID=1650571 RepID=A0ABW7UPG4_9ACTN|nr:YcnI family protein [Streptomyces pathocidini]